MFRVEVDNKTYGVRFQYRPVHLVGYHKNRHFVEVNKDYRKPEDAVFIPSSCATRTTCEILLLDDVARTHSVVATGYVTCDLRDTFTKDEGRWKAFEKAINNLRFNPSEIYNFVGKTKVDRKLFYEAYFRNHKHKRHVLENAK